MLADVLIVVLFLIPGILALIGAWYFTQLPDQTLILERLQRATLIRPPHNPFPGFTCAKRQPRCWLIGKEISVGYWKRTENRTVIEDLFIICQGKYIRVGFTYHDGTAVRYRQFIGNTRLSYKLTGQEEIYHSILTIIQLASG